MRRLSSALPGMISIPFSPPFISEAKFSITNSPSASLASWQLMQRLTKIAWTCEYAGAGLIGAEERGSRQGNRHEIVESSSHERCPVFRGVRSCSPGYRGEGTGNLPVGSGPRTIPCRTIHGHFRVGQNVPRSLLTDHRAIQRSTIEQKLIAAQHAPIQILQNFAAIRPLLVLQGGQHTGLFNIRWIAGQGA